MINIKEYKLLKMLDNKPFVIGDLNSLDEKLGFIAKHVFNISPSKFGEHPKPMNDSIRFTAYLNKLNEQGLTSFKIRDLSQDDGKWPKLKFKCLMTSKKCKGWLTKKGKNYLKVLKDNLNNNCKMSNEEPWTN